MKTLKNELGFLRASLLLITNAVTDDPQSDEHVQSCECVPDEQQRIFMRAEDQYVVGCLDEVEKYEEQVGFDDE